MKLATVSIASDTFFGVVERDHIVDLRRSYLDMAELLVASRSEHGRADIDAACHASPTHALDRVRFMPPIAQPQRILCVGANYRTYVEESSLIDEAPDHPLVFIRFPSSFVGHRELLARPSVSEQFDYEGELAVVIGTSIHRADRATALASVAGYSCLMDGTVRDFQRHTSQFTAGKNFDRSGAWGPWIVTADAVPHPHDLALRTMLDGEEVQAANTSQLVFDIGTIVSYCSSFTTLSPGDVIATGTPGGIGDAQRPSRWLRPGSDISVEIESVGTLHNTVCDEIDATNIGP